MTNHKVDWSKVRHFTQDEFDDPLYPGSGKLMNYKVVYGLDNLREMTQSPIIVLSSVDVYGEHGHSDNSYHLARNKCRAVDFYIKSSLTPRKQYAQVEKLGFGGIGVYYCWGVPIAFHVDDRPYIKIQRWVSRVKGEYEYLLGR